jgi:hypothetical protein
VATLLTFTFLMHGTDMCAIYILCSTNCPNPASMQNPIHVIMTNSAATSGRSPQPQCNAVDLPASKGLITTSTQGTFYTKFLCGKHTLFIAVLRQQTTHPSLIATLTSTAIKWLPCRQPYC